MEFIPSRPLTVGVELELQLLDKDSHDLVDGIRPLIELYPGSPHVKPECVQNTVELASRPGDSVAEIHDHLHGLARELVGKCRSFAMDLCGAGTHPFGRRLAVFTPAPRYQAMEAASGILGHAHVTFATHVHLGVAAADDAIYLMRSFKAYLPLLIAVAASSPFWRGYDTGFACYRQRLLAAGRSYGIPPSFDDWARFCEFFQASRRAGMLGTMRDIHWDVRPRPQLGTVEVRAMDAQPTISEAMQLAGFVRALAAYLLDHKDTVADVLLPHALPWWIEKDNYYVASRLGLDANYIRDKSGAFVPLAQVWQEVSTAVEPYAARLGESGYFEGLTARVAQKGVSYLQQRATYDETRSFRAVVAALVGRLRDDLGRRCMDD